MVPVFREKSQICIYRRVCVCVFVCICIHTNTHTHTHIYIYIYTYLKEGKTKAALIVLAHCDSMNVDYNFFICFSMSFQLYIMYLYYVKQK